MKADFKTKLTATNSVQPFSEFYATSMTVRSYVSVCFYLFSLFSIPLILCLSLSLFVTHVTALFNVLRFVSHIFCNTLTITVYIYMSDHTNEALEKLKTKGYIVILGEVITDYIDLKV